MQRHRKAVYPQVSLVVLVIAVALVLAACGGGGGSGAEETSTTIPPASPTTAGAAAPTKAFADLVGTTLSTTEDTPEDVGNSLDLHVPMVLAFFVTGGTDDAIVLEQLDKLALRFSDVDFYTYDYKVPAAYGDLAGQLHVDYPPQVTFVDSNGVIRGVTSGYADEGTLNQLVANIR